LSSEGFHARNQSQARNQVFKLLHKPSPHLGAERTVFYFVGGSAVGVFNLFESLLAGILVFLDGFIVGR
jgi:hypothetical protein